MSKPGFSFGLKKSGPTKPALTRRKPTTFGDDDDDDDGFPTAAQRKKQQPGAKAVAISSLDAFESLSTPSPAPSSTSKKKPHPRGGGPPPPPPSSRPTKPSQIPSQFGDLSSVLDTHKYAQAEAEGDDPLIYDYDAVYDSLKAAGAAAKKEAEEKGAGAERRPRYFDALLQAADVRERDRLIAEEKRLKRERDAEGDAFADKEAFVTEAYKKQQEENRRLEEAEKKREEAEQKKNKNRGLADFYKQMLDKGEEEHAAKIKAVEQLKVTGGVLPEGNKEGAEKGKTATERAREINAQGGNIVINDDGEVVDKRQLLKGGLNVAPKKKVEVQQDEVRLAARGPGNAGVSTKGVFNIGGGKNAMRGRQTRMLEAQLEETLKRSREEADEERAKVELVSKSRKTDSDISSARERYLARKKAAEEAKKKEEVESA
ncbi:coiled-coil domain-containing protein 55-domain containing protein [Lasiosphaeris hirsuta]|uniref:Coiled-coil domain-containing protein 55-domain containing protein n=1 Tax=Lasiosphaeris hirsuta TaxID=260670 RepID=A0AA40A879_9PEZI|nr:coiled-coil domain-containing protein 55-domain containing protein [Lasiosphaeris hirsuta]